MILGIILAFQIYYLVTLVKYNSKEYKSVDIDDYSSISAGDEVKGSVSSEDVFAYLNLAEKGIVQRLIAVSDSSGKFFVLSAEQGEELSGNYENIGKLQEGDIGSFSFKGKAQNLSDKNKMKVLNSIRSGGKTLSERAVTANDISGIMIKMNEASSDEDNTYFIMAVIGMLFIFGLIVLLLWKFVNNFIYGILVNKGKIEPELKIRKEDLFDPNSENYVGSDEDSDSFYVNTEHDAVHNTGGKAEDAEAAAEFHFTKKMNGSGSIKYEPKEPTFSDGSPIDFYSGGVNDDGNFFIDENSTRAVDSEGNEIRKY